MNRTHVGRNFVRERVCLSLLQSPAASCPNSTVTDEALSDHAYNAICRQCFNYEHILASVCNALVRWKHSVFDGYLTTQFKQMQNLNLTNRRALCSPTLKLKHRRSSNSSSRKIRIAPWHSSPQCGTTSYPLSPSFSCT